MKLDFCASNVSTVSQRLFSVVSVVLRRLFCALNRIYMWIKFFSIHADISVAAHLSNIASRTWENLRCLSSGDTVAPLLPHKNFIWNSVRKASVRSSSLLQPSKAISAFLRKRGRFSVNFREDSRWAQTIDRPQSEAECSQGARIAAAMPEGDTVPVN